MNKHMKYLLAPDSMITLPTPPAPEGVVVNTGQSANLSQAIAAEAPSATPAPASASPDPTFANFEAVANGNPTKVTLPPKPDAPVAPIVDPAKPAAVVEPVKPTVVDPTKLQPIQLKPKIDPVAQPEYAGLNDDEIKIFKSMSNEAKKFLRPVYDEHKVQAGKIKDLESKLATAPKLVDGVPLNYMEHQEAYTLTPQYKAAIRQHQLATFENEHWVSQLEAIEAGKPVKPILYNSDTGKYSYGAELQPTPSTKAAIIQQMNSTQQWQSQVAQQANQVAASHQVRYQEAVQFVKKVEDDFFPFFAKDDHEYVPVIKQVIETLPEVYRNHPLASIVAKSYAVVTELQKQLNDANVKLGQSTSGGPSDASKAGPTGQQTNSAVSAPVSTEPSDEEVRKMFKGLVGNRM